MANASARASVEPRRVGFLAYDGIAAFELGGCMDAFTNANRWLRQERGGLYELVVTSAAGGEFWAWGGLTMKAHVAFADAPEFDTIILTGGAGLREPNVCARVAAFLRERAPRTRRIVSVSTGVYGFGAAGLLDGRTITTHWRFAADVAARFPGARMKADAIFLRDGNFYSSAGVSSGIDLMLALIEEDHGSEAALSVAQEMVLYLRRDGSQVQLSESLRFQTRASDRFQNLAGWMVRNLDRDLSVETLARRANLCPRQFSRRFKAAFGVSPGHYVEQLRLDEARVRLGSRNTSIDAVGASVGYASANAFRRAFERRFGITPGDHRAKRLKLTRQPS